MPLVTSQYSAVASAVPGIDVLEFHLPIVSFDLRSPFEIVQAVGVKKREPITLRDEGIHAPIAYWIREA